MAVKTNEPGEVFDKIGEIIEIKKFRIRRVRDNWFHPMHLFKEMPDKKIEFTRAKPGIDAADRKILYYLYGNPDASFAEISENTKFAPVTIKKHFFGKRLTFLFVSAIKRVLIVLYNFYSR